MAGGGKPTGSQIWRDSRETLGGRKTAASQTGICGKPHHRHTALWRVNHLDIKELPVTIWVATDFGFTDTMGIIPPFIVIHPFLLTYLFLCGGVVGTSK